MACHVFSLIAVCMFGLICSSIRFGGANCS